MSLDDTASLVVLGTMQPMGHRLDIPQRKDNRSQSHIGEWKKPRSLEELGEASRRSPELALRLNSKSRKALRHTGELNGGLKNK